LNNRYTFKKEERIYIQKEIDLLFEKGLSFVVHPLRVVYVEKQPVSNVEAAILVSVPKKKFKRAVKRNRIKRLIREAYRLNKQILRQKLLEKGKRLLIGFIFIENKLSDWETIELAVKKSLTKLAELMDTDTCECASKE
jgi:ribonuclease P protein component